MTVKDFIKMLSDLPQDAKVVAWDADSDDYQEVSGVVYDDGTAELQTDEP